MKLREKEGWVYIVTEEPNGRVLEFSPSTDPYLSPHQKIQVTTRPHPLIIYAGRLKHFFDEASRPLISMRVMSCYSLNSNPARELYIKEADLLAYIGQYELIGVTGIGKWIWAQEDAPSCDIRASPGAGREFQRRSIDAYRELYENAHLEMTFEATEDAGPRRIIVYQPKGSNGVIPAYMWDGSPTRPSGSLP